MKHTMEKFALLTMCLVHGECKIQ